MQKYGEIKILKANIQQRILHKLQSNLYQAATIYFAGSYPSPQGVVSQIL